MARVNDPGILTAATVGIGQTVAAYSYFLPSLPEVRRAEISDTALRGDVLLGQIAAGSVSMTVGVMLSWLTGSSVPIWTTLGVALIIAIVYQVALSNERVMER